MYSTNSEEIIKSLKALGRNRLSLILERYWNYSLTEYADLLYKDHSCSLEPELLQAFDHEFQRIGLVEKSKDILSSLQRTGVLQTSTHLTASEGPTFFAIHQLASLGVPRGETYLVAAYSGVPFSSSAWSGCLNYSSRHPLEALLNKDCPFFGELSRSQKDRGRDTQECRLSLISGVMRDAPVYRAEIPVKMSQLLPHLSSRLQTLLPPIPLTASYTQWALTFCNQQMTRLLPQASVVYVDLNEIIGHYLKSILQKPQHPICRFLSEERLRNAVFSKIGDPLPLFTRPVSQHQKIRLEPLFAKGSKLEGPTTLIEMNPESLTQSLDSEQLCPGLFLTFCILCFLNGLKCLGSFEQIEYLESFQEQLQSTTWLTPDQINRKNISALTTGRCVDETGQPLFPLDVLLGSFWEFPKGQTLGQLITPLLPRLLKK
ncbi:hypothetical protein WDW89_24485 [Deltaproteobacteria bacterium TL4]